MGPHRLAAVFGVAIGVRLWHVWAMQSSPYVETLMGDSRGYDEWARQIAAGDWLGHDVFYQAPLYPYFMAAIYGLAGHNLLVVRLVQSTLGAAACVLLAAAGDRFFSRAVGLTAGLVLAFYAPAIFFDGLVQKASLDLVLTCVLLTLTARLATPRDEPVAPKPSFAPWLGAGIATGLLSLTRENALALLLPLVSWPLLRSGHTAASRTRTAATVVAGALLVLAPVAARNWFIGGELFLTTSQLGPNFYIGNNPQADGTYAPLRFGRGSQEHEREDATLLAERAVGRSLTPAEVSGYWTQRALSFIREQPLAWGVLLARKALLLVNASEMVDTESLEAHAEWSWPLRLFSPVTHFGVLIPLAVLGLYASWPARARLTLLYAIGATIALTTIAFYVFARYRHAWAPVVILFASAGLVRIWIAVSRTWVGNGTTATRGAQTWPASALVVGAAMISNWPLLSSTTMHAISATNLGTAFLEDGRTKDAERQYRQALAMQPDYAPASNNLGVVLRAQGRLDEAIAAYRTGLRARPDYPDLHYNLGNALVEKNVPAEASDHLRIAAATLPDSAAARNNLGQALAEQGQLGAAETELRRAVELDPRSATARRNLGNVLASLGRVREAEVELRHAVALDDTNGAAWYDLGSLLLESDRAADASEALSRAVRLAPESAPAHNNLGIALARGGRLEDAVAAFERALALQPELVDARRNLAMARGLEPVNGSRKTAPR